MFQKDIAFWHSTIFPKIRGASSLYLFLCLSLSLSLSLTLSLSLSLPACQVTSHTDGNPKKFLARLISKKHDDFHRSSTKIYLKKKVKNFGFLSP